MAWSYYSLPFGASLIKEDRLPSEADVTALVERIQASDTAAENELVRLYSRRIFVMALARTHDREVSRDLTQDVLIAVLQSIRNRQIRDPGKMSAFVCGTTRNLINDYFRSRAQQPVVESLSDDAPVAETDDLETVLELNQVGNLLCQIDPADRRILLMTLVEGYKAEEVASHLKLSSEAVRQRKSRAIKKIVKRLRNMSRK